MTADKREDELLKKARKLRDETEQYRQHNAQPRTTVAQSLTSKSAFFSRIGNSLRTINGVLGPVGTVLAWLYGYLRWAFLKLAYAPVDPQQPDGASAFSWRRLALSSTGVLGVGFALHIGLSAAYFYGTAFAEVVYVTGKQEIETGEVYQFGGCTSLPCSTESDNGKFYLIETSLYFPTLVYPEENVFANIPQQAAACNVQGYGFYFRSLRWLYKGFQLYQHVVDVSCRPFTDEETLRAIEQGVFGEEAETI